MKRNTLGATTASTSTLTRVVIAAVLVVVLLAVASVAFAFWWDFGPWPVGTVVEVESSGWVIVETDAGVRYRAWVAEDDRSDLPYGEYAQIHTVNSRFTAEPVPW